jgi:hypothetical protein
MWDYIRRFSRKCHELPKIYDINVISVFWSGINCQTLVHELGHDQPMTTKYSSTSPLGMPLARKLLGLSPYKAVGRRPQEAIGGRQPKQPTMV